MELIWHKVLTKEIPLNQAVENIMSASAVDAILTETAKKLIIEHYFEEFNFNDIDFSAHRDKIFENFCASQNIHNNEQFEQFLKNNNISKDILLEKLIYNEKLEKLKRTVINKQDVNEIFLREKAKADTVLFQTLNLKSEELAWELYYRIKDDGADFYQIAQNYSVSAEGKNGGIVGPVSLNTLNAELKSKLSRLQNGQIAEPFTLNGKTYMVVRMLRKDTAGLSKEKERVLLNELFEKWLTTQLNIAKKEDLAVNKA